MPSSKITNQYARRARIVPMQTHAHHNHKSSMKDLTSEEVYSLINSNGPTSNNATSNAQQNQSETNTKVNNNTLYKKASFLKILVAFICFIVIIGSSAYVIDLKNNGLLGGGGGGDIDNSSNGEQQRQNNMRRHSIGLETDDTTNNNTTDTSTSTSNSISTSSQHVNVLLEANTAYGEKIELPSSLDDLANVMDPVRSTDVPTFWHIPRAGGSTVKDITTTCLMLVQASQVGVAISKDDTELKVVEDIEGGKFMNVDTTTPHGINRAVKFGLAASSELDLVVTPYVHLAAKLFDSNHRGRMFTIMRHPIDRAVSLFHAMKNNKHTKSMLEDVSLESYAKGSMVENNWMTRFLANQQNGELSLQHEVLAKEILRTKFLIGLLKYKDASMSRFELNFDWKIQTEKGQDCHERLLDWNWSNKNLHPTVDSKSSAYKLLEKQNEYDIRLYDYAERLFRDQAMLFQKNDNNKKKSKHHVQDNGIDHNYKPLAELKNDHHFGN